MVIAFLQGLSDAILTPILKPLLSIPPIMTILAVALFISIVSLLFQKYLTDQKKLKRLKADMKKLQAEARKHAKDPDKALAANKKMMAMQGPMMKESMRPMIWTMLPFLLLFLWLSSHFAYLPLLPGEEFSVTAKVEDGLDTVTLETLPEGLEIVGIGAIAATVSDGEAVWALQGPTGFYTLNFYAGEKADEAPAAAKNIVITEQKEYEVPLQQYKGAIKTVKIGNRPLKPLDPFSILGWRPGWIWVYLFFSLAFSMGGRKLMGVV